MSAALPARVVDAESTSGRPSTDRLLALGGAAVLTGSYLVTLYHVVDVVGGPGGLELFVAVVAGSLGLAVVLGRTLRVRHAVVLGAVLMAGGLGAYLLAIPAGALDIERSVTDTVSLVTGLSVLRMTKAAVWALGFTPGPVFVSTYLFLRRRYALGVLVGGAALAFFVSTSDVGAVQGLVGALGAIAALGFGRLDREAGTASQRDAVVVLLVAVLVVTTSVSLVPGAEARPLLPGDRGNTVERSLVAGGDSLTVVGSIELSPRVRFTVTANRPARWRAGAFDRYTGNGWIRSGQTTPYAEPLSRPATGEIARFRQTVQVRSPTNVMPAAWKPARVADGEDVLVTSMGALEPAVTLAAGDRYTVISYRPVRNRRALQDAGTGYPDGMVARYTQLPESTPDRVGTFTAELTAEAETPYETARVVERWLETNKEYSLQVDRPSGDVAAGFIFDMNQGYCTYYATAMVAMLRTQGIPARFVTGYTAGEATGEDQWTVRGLNSHAWVEVYFPGHGWVPFDPTPASPRRTVERARIEQARAAGLAGVDPGGVTPVAGGGNVSLAELETPEERSSFNGTIAGTPTIPRRGGAGPASNPGGGGPGGLPDEETMLYGLVLLIGAATAAHRGGLVDRARRLVWVRRQPDGPPGRRIAGTFDRLDYLLGRQYRPRRQGETPRAYLAALRSRAGPPPVDSGAAGPHDRRLDRLFELYEQARYAGRATAADADRAWRLLAELREEWSDWA